jgi:cytochrome c oxidase subunit 4
MSEDVQAHIRTYLKIGGALGVLTAVTVAVSYIDFWGVPVAVVVALVIAATKGSLVVSFFMHLIEEKKMILATLVLTVFFFMVLIFLPLLGHADKHGEYYTIPNANAPAAAPAAGH